MSNKSKYVTKFSPLFFILPFIVLADIKSEYKALFQSLNVEMHSDEYIKCGLMNHARLHHLIQQMNPEMKELAKQIQIFARPNRQDSTFSPNGHFLMYFNTTGTHAVPDADIEGNGIPDYIDSAGVYLEKSWDMEIDQLGFYPPPGKHGNPVEVYPIYFTDFRAVYGVSYYGLTTPEETIKYNGVSDDANTSFIELHNDYEGTAFYSKGLDGLKVTAAHEFNHAIQFGYTAYKIDNFSYNYENKFFMEMTSTWLEDYVFDEVNDYVFYLNTGYKPFFKNIFSISFTSTDSYDPYANCLYIHMLEKQYEPEIVVDIWNRIINENAFNALDNELIFRNTSFAESQNQYAGWLYFTGSRSQPDLYFPEGTEYPEIELNTGIDALGNGLVGESMRLIELIPQINGLSKVKVSSASEGKFSHILNGQNLTRPHEFNSNEILALAKNEPVIVVLSNPNSTIVTDLEYEVKREKVTTGPDPVVINSESNQLQFSNVPENATIRIFNILGQKIHTLYNQNSNQVQWNIRDHSGKRLTTGTYIYFIKSGGYEFAGKLTILK